MASYQFFIAALVLVFVQQSNGQDDPTDITFTPPTLTLTPNASDSTGGQVTISCRASSAGNGYMTTMNLHRVPHTSPNAAPVLVVAASRPDEVNAVLKLTSLQGSVTGGLDEKSITLTMNRANCGDAGTYICTASAIVDSSNKNYEHSRNLTIEVSPGSITMTPEPSGTSIWSVNDTLLMRCNGIVGTVQDDSQLEWIWEYQDGNRFPGVENWQPYSNIGDSSADIQTDPSIPTTNSCYKRQISVLTRHLTMEDTDREYRCYVINNDMSGNQNAQANAQFISVGTVSESDQGTGGQSPSTGDGSDSPAKADVGAIVGGVIGALIVIVVIIVLVYFLVIRKRRQQDKPDPSKPADEQPPPGYSTGPDPHVTYSQPTRTSNNRFKKDKEDKARGQTNKAMDDTDDKPYKPRHSPQPQDYDTKPPYESKPARYENDIGRDYDRNQGRRNRAYDDDGPRTPRRYSSDDGGTDTNVNMNTSMHSMHSVGRGDPNIGTAI